MIYKLSKITTCIFILSITYLCAYDFPRPESLKLETESLILRLISFEDECDIFEFTSDPEVAQFTGMFDVHVDHDQTNRFIQSKLDAYEKRTCLTWAIIYKPENKVIGLFNIFGYCPDHFKGEIGYVISRHYWNYGFATQATQCVISFGFNILGLNRIQATFDPRNRASGRVLEKIGFKYEGLLREYCYLKNEFCDRIVLSILKKEYISP